MCNSCDVDVKVQFDTWSGPWHTNFQSTSPIASADETVTLQSVPCRGYGTVSGFSALSGGSFKSTVRVALVGGAFDDDMDPELEIEDNHPFKHLYKWGGPGRDARCRLVARTTPRTKKGAHPRRH